MHTHALAYLHTRLPHSPTDRPPQTPACLGSWETPAPDRAGDAGRHPRPAPRNLFSPPVLKHRVPHGHFELPSQTLFPKSVSNLTHFSFKTRKHQQTRGRETDGNNYRREKTARSLYEGQANRLVPDSASFPGHSWVNLGTGLQGPSPLQGTGQHWRGRKGLQAPQGRPTGTWQRPVLQGGRERRSSTFQATSLPLTPCLRPEICVGWLSPLYTGPAGTAEVCLTYQTVSSSGQPGVSHGWG